MKRFLFLMLLGCLLTGIRANAQQPYVVKTTEGTALTFYYDTLKNSRTGTTYDIKSFSSMKAPWCDTLVTTVTIDTSFKSYKPTDTSRWFTWMTGLKSINGTENLNTSAVRSMDMMFENCKALTSLDLSSWDVSSVTDMGGMFAYCSSLTDLNLKGWDVGHVRYMSQMFYGCQSLTALNVSAWDVSRVTDMDKMFGYCTSLAALDVSRWNTGSVEDVRGMFEYCTKIATLDVSNWDMSNVQDAGAINNPVMQDMFRGCRSLTSLDLSKWDIHQVTDMSNMFNGCTSLTTVGDLSGWNTASICNISGMFAYCVSLRELNVKNWNTSHVSSLTEFLQNVGTYTRPLYLDIDNTFSFYVKGTVTDHDGVQSYTWQGGIIAGGAYVYALQSPDSTTLTFYYDNAKYKRTGRVYEVKKSYQPKSAASILGELSDFAPTWTFSKKIQKVIVDPTFYGFKPEDMFAWFFNMNVDTITGLENINTVNVESMGNLFRQCTSLTSIDVSKLDVSHTKELNAVFCGDTLLAHITGLSSWDVSHATYFMGMFEDCTSLTSVADLAQWNLVKATNLRSMFRGCSGISSFDDIAYWNVDSVTQMNGMFQDCKLLTHIDLSHWNIGKSSEMDKMFQNTPLTAIDLSNNHIETVSPHMFASCTKLESVILPEGLKNIGKGKRNSIFDYGDSFVGCSSLKSINLPEGLTLIGYQSFKGCTSLEKMVIPNSVTTMGDESFVDCTSLKEINIPNGVTSLNGVFTNCSSLQSIKIPNSVVDFGSGFFGLGRTFENCVSLKHVTLPSNLDNTCIAPFSGTNITSITIPAKVKEHKFLFSSQDPDLSGMKHLKEIFLMGDTIFSCFPR
jgi:surface protein